MRSIWGPRDHKGIKKTVTIIDVHFYMCLLPTLSLQDRNLRVRFALGFSHADAGGEPSPTPFSAEWGGNTSTKFYPLLLSHSSVLIWASKLSPLTIIKTHIHTVKSYDFRANWNEVRFVGTPLLGAVPSSARLQPLR